MPTEAKRAGLFPAQLKYWRHKRGLSQLDFSLTADVSSRHISFLETGRARPSREMVLRLARALAIPLRDQNTMLRAAGFEPRYEEPSLDHIPESLRGVLTRMMAQHEPYPMIVMDRLYNVLETNRAGAALMARLVANPALAAPPFNVVRMLFHPELARPFIERWEPMARFLIARLHQLALLRGEDEELRALIDEILAFPDVPEDWREPDFSTGHAPVFTVRVRIDDRPLAFTTTLTHFSEPQDVTLQELQIESYFPIDDETEAFCRALA